MKMDSDGKRQWVLEEISRNTGAVRTRRTLVDSEFRLGNQKTYLRIS